VLTDYHLELHGLSDASASPGITPRPSFCLFVSDADSAKRDLLPTTRVNRVVRNIDSFERELSAIKIRCDTPLISQYSIRCNVSCHHCKISLKGAWSGHVNHINFGGHQPTPWNGLSYSRQIWYTDRLCPSQHKNDKSPLKGAWSGSRDPFSILTPAIISPKRLKRDLPNFVCRGGIYQVLSFG